jgi:hypothetical protein
MRASRLPEEKALLIPLRTRQQNNKTRLCEKKSRPTDKSWQTPDMRKTVFRPYKSAQIPLGSSKHNTATE